MGLKSDKWIRQKSLEERMIEPFCEDNLNPSSYDITLGNLFKTPVNNSDNRTDFFTFVDKSIIINAVMDPSSIALAMSLCTFKRAISVE